MEKIASAGSADVGTKATMAGGRYRFSANDDGTYNIHDVEIMGEMASHARMNPKPVGAKWHQRAVDRAKLRAKEGYVAPLHVYHHGDGDGRTERAGFVLPTKVGTTVVGGKKMATIYADLQRIPAAVFERIKNGELPYRSVELPPWTHEPEILSLALLPDEAPHFKFALLKPGEEIAADSVTHYSNDVEAPLRAGYRLASGEAIILCRNRFGGAKFMEKDEKDEGAKMMQPDELEAAIVAVLKKHGVIKDEAKEGEMAEDEEEEVEMANDKATNTNQAPTEQAAGKPSAIASAETIKLQARVAALEKNDADRKADEAAQTLMRAVRAEHLADYDLDEKAEALMLKLARANDREGLVTFATVYADTADPRKPNTLADYENRAARGRASDSKEVAAFATKGPDALDRARKIASEYRKLKAHVPDYPLSLERYIAVQFERDTELAAARGTEEEE